MPKVELNNVWKIFGPNPQHLFKTMDRDATRDEILSETGHVVAVRDVSLQIAESEIFVVMGLSGSGKSTLIRCLSRLIEPTSGSVLINSADVTAMDTNALRELRRRTVSMVFQRFGLFPHRRVIDNVAFGLEIQGKSESERLKMAGEVLELVGLTSWGEHYPHELSGGMQQRVGLARALAVDPEIMLCDEPFSALDPLIRRDMQNELLHLQSSLNKTIIFITHDFLEAIKLGDRIAIMKDGALVQIGTPQEIVANPVVPRSDQAWRPHRHYEGWGARTDWHAAGNCSKSGRHLCARIYAGCAAGQGAHGRVDHAAAEEDGRSRNVAAHFSKKHAGGVDPAGAGQ